LLSLWCQPRMLLTLKDRTALNTAPQVLMKDVTHTRFVSLITPLVVVLHAITYCQGNGPSV
ncbi:hypothetical protein Bpfe_021376, partial [Biomphalaria pfeifferi]